MSRAAFDLGIVLLTMEKAMAPHSSTLAWKIPWMEEPVGLQSMGSRRVGHDWATSLSLFIFMHWRRKWQPTPVFLPGESQGRGSLGAAVSGVAQSWTRLKRLSSSKEISKDLGKVLERILLYSFAVLVPTQSLFRLLFTGCSLSSFLIAHPTYSSKGSCLHIQKALFVQYPLSIILFFVFDELTAFGQ